MDTLGKRIRYLRGSESQEDFARRIGVSKGAIGGYERDVNSPSADAIVKICSMNKISSDWLLFGTGPIRADDPGREQQSAPCSICAAAAKAAPVDVLILQAKAANDRLFQAFEAQLAMQKEIGKLHTEIAVLKEQIVSRDRIIADLREIYEIRKESVGPENLSVLIARSKGSINK